MKEENSSSRLIQDILTQGDKVFSKIVTEAETVKVLGKIDPDIKMRRNELLLKIDDQISEVSSTLEHVETLRKQLKKHLGELQQFRKILSK